jgi:acyl transferase domain-containing protein
MLEAGTDGFSEMPLSRWDLDAYYDPDPDSQGSSYVIHGGFI